MKQFFKGRKGKIFLIFIIPVVLIFLMLLTGFILQISGITDSQITSFIRGYDYTNMTGQNYSLQLYAFSIVYVYGEIPAGDPLKCEYGGEWSVKVFVFAGFPLFTYGGSAIGWE